MKTTFTIILAVLISLSNVLGLKAQTIPAYVPANGLTGWWPFNGNANDESGNGHNATSSGAVLTLDRYGSNNSAYDCSSGYLVSSSTTGIPRNGPMSISVWFNATGNFLIGEFICLGNPSNTTWGAVGGYNAFTVNYGRGCGSTGSSLQNINIAYNEWHHVVYVSDGFGGHSDIYYDGVFFGTSVNASSSGCSSTNLYFGIDIYYGYNLEYYMGSLDDIGIWNRALTPCEISGLFLASNPGSITIQPDNQTVSVGNNTQLIVASSDPSATFQWQINAGSGFQNIYNGGQYSGTTNDTLTISNVNVNNNNSIYRCILTSNGCPETSNNATLTIIKKDADPYIEMPNVFTPNNDGANDNFIPVKYKGISDATLQIFNRWGEELFSTTSLMKGWNGYYKDQLCSDGTYFWLIKYSISEHETNEIKGFLTLLK